MNSFNLPRSSLHVSGAAQYVFITLLFKEGAWHRKHDLSDRIFGWEEVGPAMTKLSESLPQLGAVTYFCNGIADMTFDERLDSLTKEELHKIAAKVGPKVAHSVRRTIFSL